MFNLESDNTTLTHVSTSYADTFNARFLNASSNIKTIEQRWNDTYNSLPPSGKHAVNYALSAAIAEFRRRNPTFKTWEDVSTVLAKAWIVPMSAIKIDATMQRHLNINWVLELLNTFVSTKVVPIQVYMPNDDQEEYLGWDGQHTLVLLWLIATRIMDVDPSNITIPVNVYHSSRKDEMRTNFIDLNSEAGKKALDLFDKFEQMVYAVRVDNSTNPLWRLAETKQQILENHGLFATKRTLCNYSHPGAVSRLQEVYKLTPEALENLCTYLVGAGAQTRPVEEKEMVMMAYFFDRCRAEKIKFTQSDIFQIVAVVKNHWNADFTPTSKFWNIVNNAYRSWHSIHGGLTKGVVYCKKEPLHGYPFLVEQLKKDLPTMSFPSSETNSLFIPAQGDLL